MCLLHPHLLEMSITVHWYTPSAGTARVHAGNTLYLSFQLTVCADMDNILKYSVTDFQVLIKGEREQEVL